MALKILTVVGARPQFIKAAAVSRAIRETDGLSEVMVHTGQHFDPNMSDVFFDELDIPTPRHHLDINGGGHGDMTGRMLMAIEPILLEEKPGLGRRLWRYKFDAGRVTGGIQAAHPRGACRSGTSLVQSPHAGRTQPDRHGPSFHAASLSYSDGGRESRAEGVVRGRPPCGRRDVRCDPVCRPARQRRARPCFPIWVSSQGSMPWQRYIAPKTRMTRGSFAAVVRLPAGARASASRWFCRCIRAPDMLHRGWEWVWMA